MYNLKESIILEYNNPSKNLFIQSIKYTSYFILVFVFLVLFIKIYEKFVEDSCHCSDFYALAIILFIFWIIILFILSIALIPAYENFKKYTKLIINKQYLYINDKRYNISELEFKIEYKSLHRVPIMWNYLAIYKENELVGKFIVAINSYYFFGMSREVIIRVLKRLKENQDFDYQRFMLELILDEYTSNKENTKYIKIIAFIIFIPIVIFLALFFGK